MLGINVLYCNDYQQLSRTMEVPYVRTFILPPLKAHLRESCVDGTHFRDREA